MATRKQSTKPTKKRASASKPKRTFEDKAREMSGETMNIYRNGKLVYSGR